MFCPNCGKEIPDGSKFCPYCGESLKGRAGTASKGKPARNLSKIIIPLIIIIILLSSAFAYIKFIKPNIGSNTQKETIATLIPYRKGDKWGFCDRNKKLIIPAVYDYTEGFSEGLAAVKVNGKYGFIDTKGTMIIPAVYDWAYDFSEGLVAVKVNGKCGFIDTKGNMVIPAVYDDAYFFHEGLASVQFNGKWGYIDTKGTQYWED